MKSALTAIAIGTAWYWTVTLAPLWLIKAAACVALWGIPTAVLLLGVLANRRKS